MSGSLHRWRHLLLRRATQAAVMGLFLGTAQLGWSVAERPLLMGNLSASELLGAVPMADPFATLQILFTGRLPAPEVLLGALLVLAFYALVGGRVFCAWVCPVNLVTDAAAWLRRRLGLRDQHYIPRATRYGVLALSLLLSLLSGVAAFEWLSPIGMAHRELIYGAGLGWAALTGIFIFDLLLLRHGWCGHLCPLGAFYAQIGRRAALVRVRFDAATCTHCLECVQVCPEPQVLNLKKAAESGLIASGECSNCGRCIPACPEGSLAFGTGRRVPPRYDHLTPNTTANTIPNRRAAT